MAKLTIAERQVYWVQVVLALQHDHGLLTKDKRSLDWHTIEALMAFRGLIQENGAPGADMVEATVRALLLAPY